MSSMPENPKRTADFVEGTEAAQRFEKTMDRILRVSKQELTKRETAYQRKRRAQKKRARR